MRLPLVVSASLSAAALFVLAGCSRETAQDQNYETAQHQNYTWCPGGPGISPDRQVSSCTAIIQSGQETPANLAAAYNDRGEAYRAKGDYVRAIADYDRAIQLDPDDAAAYSNRGLAYRTKGDFDRAIADYDRAIQLKPDYATAYSNRGIVYKVKGDYDRAIADSDRAIQLKPDYASPYINRGQAYSAKGDYDRAIADYDQAIQLKPDRAATYNSRCWVRAIRGRDLGQALSDCDMALRLDPKELVTSLDSRAFVNFRLGRYEQAVADETTVLEKNPKVAASLYVRGLAKIAKGLQASGAADIAAAKALKSDIAEEYARYGVPPLRR
jgi:tetratricopeptide (TPR) repeat protein